jgi:hypothetical protein
MFRFLNSDPKTARTENINFLFIFVIGTDKEKIEQKENLRGRNRESERRGDFSKNY